MKEETERERKTCAGDAGAGAEEAAGSPGAGEAAPDGGVADGDGASPEPGEEPAAGAEASAGSGGADQRPNVSLREILGGDILTAGWLRRQTGLISLCTFLAVIYITNRYSAEQEMIEIEKSRTELTEARYRALARRSELTVRTRQSQIEESLRQTPDSVLQSPKEPPFLIKPQNEEEE